MSINTTYATSWTLANNATGHIQPDAYDVFRFVAPQSGYYTLQLTSAAAAAVTLQLYDASGNESGDVVDTVTQGNTIQTRIAVDAGSTYFLAATAPSSTVTYTLSAPNFTPTTDNNDTRATAPTVSDSFQVNGTVGSGDLVDYVKYVALETGTLTFVSNTGSGVSAQFYVGLNDWFVGRPTLNGASLDVSAHQTYYLRLDAPTAATAAYSVAGTFVPVADDGMDTFDTAAVIQLPEYNQTGGVSGHVRRSDPVAYYTFTAPKDGSLDIHMFGLIENADLTLYDSSRNVIATSANPGTADELAHLNVKSGDTFYLGVQLVNGTETPFSVDMAFKQSYDNESFSTAASATLPLTTNNILGDVSSLVGAPKIHANDFTVFTAPQTGVVRFHMEQGAGLITHFHLKVYDGAHTLIAEGTPAAINGGEVAAFAVRAGQPYFLEVTSDGTKTNSYSLHADYDNGEADNTFAGAHAITVPQFTALPSQMPVLGGGTTGDVVTDPADYYAFTPKQLGTGHAGRATFSLANVTGTETLGIKIYDSQQTLVAQSTAPFGTPVVSFDVAENATYYVSVYGDRDGLSSYNLIGGVELSAPDARVFTPLMKQPGGYELLTAMPNASLNVQDLPPVPATASSSSALLVTRPPADPNDIFGLGSILRSSPASVLEAAPTDLAAVLLRNRQDKPLLSIPD